MKLHQLSVCIAASIVLAACGGGGGSSSTSETPATAPGLPSSGGSGTATTYNAQMAWNNLLSTTRTWTVSGVASDGKTYELTLSIAPGGTLVFPVTGATTSRAVFRNGLKEGSTVLQDVVNEQFFDSEYRMLGTRVTTDGGTPTCSKTEVVAALPLSAAPAGATGPLYAGTTLAECTTTAAQLGTSYHTWSLLAEGGVTYFCVASSNRFLGESTDRLSETCVETDAAGKLGAKARIQLLLPGFSVIAKN